MSNYRHLCCVPASNFAGWKYLAVLQPVPITVVVVVVDVVYIFFSHFSNPAVGSNSLGCTFSTPVVAGLVVRK